MTIKDQEAGGREEIDWWLEAEEAALSQLDRLMAEEISDEIIDHIPWFGHGIFMTGKVIEISKTE